MASSSEELQALAAVFQATLSPDRDTIKQAEVNLKAAGQQPGYSIKVLQLIALPDLDVAIRQSAAVNFKNLVKYRWMPSDADVYGGAQPVTAEEKAAIKHELPGLMLNTPSKVQAQLSEALSIICSHDFPKAWPNLLGDLKARLDAADMTTVQGILHTAGVLQTANSIFKRYRNQYRSNAMVNELEQSQNDFVGCLVNAQKRLTALVPQAVGNAEMSHQLLTSIRYVFRIFYSLNAPGLTPLFEEQLDFWMAEFHTYLVYTNPALAETDPEKESIVDAVKSAVCENINLFIEVNEEEFQKYLQMFAADVWGVLMGVSLRTGQDNLAMAAIKFLTTISRTVHYTIFQDAGALQQICQSIIVPNMKVRPEDEEVFELNPLEYIRRDAEGSDSDTRRRAAADLVKSLTEKFPAEVTQLFIGYVSAMLAEYAANPAANWKSKDCAIYMVLALTVRGSTGAQGATKTNELVNLLDFFSAQVLPELQSAKLNDNPILKADAIKFVTTFRSILPKEALLATVPHLITMLGSEYNVVHSYAATAIERLLSTKERGQLRFSPSDLSVFLQPMLEKLFAGFKLPESSENEYLMKCVMRVIGFVGPTIAPISGVCLQALAEMLLEVCKNPKNPGFNHYLFESVAALIKHGVAGDPALIERFEQMLFPAFNHVLQQDVQEFHPYVFQIFAQLIELRPAPLPEVYLTIFPPLLSPVFWERSGNVPALVRLLQAYLTKAATEVVAGGHIPSVLGVFQKLIASKAHDHEGFFILNALIEFLPLASYEQYLPTIWGLLFHRLQHSRTNKFTRAFLVFMALFICKVGTAATEAQLNKVQPGMFIMLLQQVWLPNIQYVEGGEEEKLVAVASTKCLCESPALKANQATWAALRTAVEQKLSGTGGQAGGGPGQEEEDLDEEAQGYTAAYAKLANASRPERPVLAEIQDPKQYVESSLQQLYQQSGVR